MKRLFIVLFYVAATLGFAQNNGSLRGTIKEEGSLKQLANITVFVNSSNQKQETLTNSQGEFYFANVPNGKCSITIISNFHKKKLVDLTINGKSNIGEIYLASNSSSTESMEDLISLSDEELNDDSENEGISGILSASNDIFGRATAYTFSWARFRRRGLGSEYQDLYFDGLPFNNMENGRAYWYLWGGLNDATRNKVYTEGLRNSDYGYGNVGGTTNIISRADEQRKGTKVTYSLANRSYSNRVLLTHSTGVMSNGWAFTGSLSKRWAEEGNVEGTFYDAYGYLFSAFKKINYNHSINFTVFGAPSERGGMGTSVQEMKDIADDNFYNPKWGYQNGEKRSASVQKSHTPVAILQHFWDVSDRTKITTSLSMIKGESGRTALDWNNDEDPRPDYYRYLPSYQLNDNMSQQVYDKLVNNKAARQINWDKLIQTNKTAHEDGRGVYALTERRNDVTQYIANILATHELNDNITIRGGAYYNKFTGHHFNVMNDLLGAEYYLDIDQFAERDFGTGRSSQTDLVYYDTHGESRKVKEGDTYNNDYDANVNKIRAFLQGEFSYQLFDFYASASYTNTQMWREGYLKHGLFENNSLGESKKLKFNDFAVKAGGTYKHSGHHYFVANATYMKVAPTFRSAFLSPRNRNDFVNGIEAEKILATDIGYKMKYDFLKFDVNLYYTSITDRTETRSYYTNWTGSKGFINSIMTGINQTNMGAEIAFDLKLHTSLSLIGAAAVGVDKYSSRPDYRLIVDNSAEVAVAEQPVYIKNFKVTGYPQQAYTLGLNYRHPSYTWIGLNANYYSESYLNMSPLRRTQEALDGITKNSDLYNKVVEQEKIDGTFTLDLNIGKSWRIDYKYYINLNVSVSNLLDTRDFKSGGYEQSRLNVFGSGMDVDKFPPKYYYAFGRSYFVNLSFRF